MAGVTLPWATAPRGFGGISVHQFDTVYPVRTTPLPLGNPAPWFVCRSLANPAYNFSSVAGRYVVLFFFGTAGNSSVKSVLEGFTAARAAFDDNRATFFGVSTDPEDVEKQRIAQLLPGMRYFLDFDLAVSKAYGVVSGAGQYQPMTYLLDEALRVIAVIRVGDPATHCSQVLQLLQAVPLPRQPMVIGGAAPVLTVPYVFEPELCRRLIQWYGENGGSISGFMEDRDGKTVGVVDFGTKKRRDAPIEDEELKALCLNRLEERLIPAIRRAFQFNVTRLERHIVSCYDASEGGYFHAHRDNTTRATAYRRFAVSLFLNTGEYEGGFLRFPEFGNHFYTAPPGGGIVFSCSLLHEATPVTKGKRYMYLPFLYDEEANRIRSEVAHHRIDETLIR